MCVLVVCGAYVCLVGVYVICACGVCVGCGVCGVCGVCIYVYDVVWCCVGLMCVCGVCGVCVYEM